MRGIPSFRVLERRARRLWATYNRRVKSLYEKTIAFVLQYIDEHKLGTGAQLPTETQVSALAGVSLVTVRRALVGAFRTGRRAPGTRARHVRRKTAGQCGNHQDRRPAPGLASGCALETANEDTELRARSSTKEEAASLGLSQGASVVGGLAPAILEQAARDLGDLGYPEDSRA